MVNEYKLKLDATLHVFCYFKPTVVVLWGKMTTISDISHHLLSGLLQCPVNSPETAFNHPVFFPKDLQSLQNWLKMSTNMHCTLWNMFKVQYVLVKIRWIFSATGGAWRVCPYNCLLNISNSCRDVSQGFEKKGMSRQQCLIFTQLFFCYHAVIASSSSSSSSMYGISRSLKFPIRGLLVGEGSSWQGRSSASITAWATSDEFSARLCFWRFEDTLPAKRSIRLA